MAEYRKSVDLYGAGTRTERVILVAVRLLYVKQVACLSQCSKTVNVLLESHTPIFFVMKANVHHCKYMEDGAERERDSNENSVENPT